MLFDLTFIVALVVVVTIHEFSHAFVAYKLGDPTAKIAGRVTLNPLAHLDLVGTIMLFLIHIGWGKPVPVNPLYFRKPKRDEALTALAGPFSNLVLALVLVLPIKYLSGYMGSTVTDIVGTVLDVSILLFVFNMIPLPPLDGSKIIGFFIPGRYQRVYRNFLYDGVKYFVIFLLFDQFVLLSIFQFSILQLFIGTTFTFIKSLLFLGT